MRTLCRSRQCCDFLTNRSFYQPLVGPAYKQWTGERYLPDNKPSFNSYHSLRPYLSSKLHAKPTVSSFQDRLVKRCYCSAKEDPSPVLKGDSLVKINSRSYEQDDFTNVTPKILSHLDRKLHLQPQHPIGLIKQRIVDFINKTYINSSGMPLFEVCQELDPVVTVENNFDSLMVPKDHVSRSKSDTYYVNRQHLLRSHTSAHQLSLLQSGKENFLVVGDVYRRDEIDASHYPVFHQMEGVRLLSPHDLRKFARCEEKISIFEDIKGGGGRTEMKQDMHTLEAAKITEAELKTCLVDLARHLFGDKIQYRWVDAYFPFTHPSFELEVFYNNDWLEVLGCGVMEQDILTRAGINDKIGWAFGLGLERLAMVLYSIPDIRIFWSKDTGFLSQFEEAKPDTRIVFKPVSKAPQCTNDISFWLPGEEAAFACNDFYDLVRNVGGDMVEQVRLVDSFYHKKKGLHSHCYRIVYRDPVKVLTQDEVNAVHKNVENEAVKILGVTIR